MSPKKKMVISTDDLAIQQQSDMRKDLYLKAAQSQRVPALVGSAQKSFQVPQDLLIQCSSALGKICRLVSDESPMRVIKLPEVKPSTFEDFFIWLHTHEPRVKSTDMVAVFDLAIFADMYIIYDLMNQTSDVIRKALSDGSWQLTPDIVSRVYDGVPSGSILRQLCSSALTTNRSRQCSDLSVWKPVFEKCADLGWDYFRQMQTSSRQISDFNSGLACFFHDHSNVLDWIYRDEYKCPYPYGAPLSILKPDDVCGGLQEEGGSRCLKEELVDRTPTNEVVVNQVDLFKECVNQEEKDVVVMQDWLVTGIQRLEIKSTR